MKVLLIDTCGATGSVTLADTETVPSILATETLPGRTASERLVATIRQIAAANEVPLDALGAIVVVHGPGSFTGVRVGLSAGKGLCEALDVPLVAISRLAVLAASAGPAPLIHALFDAGRGEFYYGAYTGDVCLRESLLTRDQFQAILIDSPLAPLVVCQPAVAEALADLSPHLVPEPDAPAAWPLALGRIRRAAFDGVASIDANYLRRTDAEIFAKLPR